MAKRPIKNRILRAAVLAGGLATYVLLACQGKKVAGPCDGGYTDSDSVWHVDTLAVAKHVTVNGIWGVTPCDVYAVGSVTDSSGPQGVIWHYNGSSWSVVHTTPNAEFHDVYKVSSASVWVVGVSSPESYPGGSLIAHGNGTQWDEHFSDPPARGLLAVWAPDDQNVYAVGQRGTILSFAHGSWRREDNPSLEGLNPPDIYDVWGRPASDSGYEVYAAGAGGTYGGVLMRRFPVGTGARWGEVFSSLVFVPSYENHFAGVWVDSQETIWVLETYQDRIMYDFVLYRFQHNNWTLLDLPAGSGSYYGALRGDTSGVIYLLGCRGVFRFEGSNWSSTYPEPVAFTLNDVWPSGTELFVCGNSDSCGVVLRTDRFTSVSGQP
ncbi:MAG: hypothetical protein HY304_01660 [candidate division Zixibacteria bacterium]|nr:hypothetical protein [candidate division Zixibacteria bacterium]